MAFIKDKVAVWCYSEWAIEEVKSSTKKFKEGVACCDGSEKERYANILVDLMDIRESSIEDLKASGWRFYKKGNNYYPVASDQDEELMKKTDTYTFTKQITR